MVFRLAVSAMMLAALAAPVLAQSRRPDARQMSCAQVHDLIARQGAAVLTTGRHTYERYVSTSRFCMSDEAAAAVVISTRDTDRCWVNRCLTVDYDD